MLTPSKISQLKELFSTGKKPTGADFALLIEWFSLASYDEMTQDSFIATEGQELFRLSKRYIIGEHRLLVDVGGVLQYSPMNYNESSNFTITFNSGLQAGAPVNIRYVGI